MAVTHEQSADDRHEFVIVVGQDSRRAVEGSSLYARVEAAVLTEFDKNVTALLEKVGFYQCPIHSPW